MTTVERHRTAMSRSMLSRPMQHAIDDGLVNLGTPIFDYGCGRGDDIRTLSGLGYTISGWDPAHAADQPLLSAPIVNLGYVINVIEDPTERSRTLQAAWGLTASVLIVSARLQWDPDSNNGTAYGDGRLSKSGTFQKYYRPEELKAWISETLNEAAITASPGIYYVFRDSSSAQALLAHQSRANSRPRIGIAELLYSHHQTHLASLESWVDAHRKLPSPTDLVNAAEISELFGSIRAAFSIIRRVTGPQQWTDINVGTRRKSDQLFTEHLDDLQPLMDFVSDRGRLPRKGELANEAPLNDAFGSLRSAFSTIRRVTGPDRWTDLETTARGNFLVYSALSAFGGRPRFSELPDDLQYDVKDLFGSYVKATAEADKLLYSIADLDKLGGAIQDAPYGKLTPEALYVHTDGLHLLPPVLRVYQGAARTITGNVDDTTLLKLHRLKPQVSFLAYPEFETDPHPALDSSVVARLPELRASFRNFSNSDNPPILHRKETFIPDDHPHYAKYARLSAQEEKAGLLSADSIGRRDGWGEALEAAGKRLRGHRLVNAN